MGVLKMVDAQYGSCVVLTMLLLALAHWVPVRRKMDRLLRYVIGTACIFIGQAAWLAHRGEWETVAALAVFPLAAGFTVGLVYTIDKANQAKTAQDVLANEVEHGGN